MAMDLFIQLSIIVAIALAVSIIINLLRQPLIIGYIVTGIIAGPSFLDLIDAESSITTFGKLGIALLLFMVGLNLNPKVIKEVGAIALITGIGQIIFTFVICFLVAKLLNFNTISSIYMALAMSFSSTIIIMKLLADKGDLSALYGKISIGFLIVQDIVAIIILIIISSLNEGASMPSLTFNSLLMGIGLIVLLFLIGVFILPFITKKIAKSQELLLLFSIGWCIALASLFYYYNFSFEIGALLAGMTLSISSYKYEISSRLRPLRDFFLLIFFIVLGAQMSIANIPNLMPSVIIFSLLVIIGNPLIILSLMGIMKYTKRNGFLCGLTVSQISEFSFILISLGISLGHIDKELLSLITLVGLITIASSTYLILYSERLYARFSSMLNIFEIKGKKIDGGKYYIEKEYNMVLFGYNRIGFDILESFRKLKKRFLVVDYNPEVINQLVKKGIDCLYGDAGDSELLDDLNISRLKMIVSTIPDLDTNLLITKKIRNLNKEAIIILISHQVEEAFKLYKEGATYVILPHFLGGDYSSKLIEKNCLDIEKFSKERAEHLEKLKARKKQGHEHPKHERN